MPSHPYKTAEVQSDWMMTTIFKSFYRFPIGLKSRLSLGPLKDLHFLLLQQLYGECGDVFQVMGIFKCSSSLLDVLLADWIEGFLKNLSVLCLVSGLL